MESAAIEALEKLSETEHKMSTIEARVVEVKALLCGPSGCQLTSEKLGALKTELSLLESQAKQLESTGVDSVYAGDLASGKARVKETKKKLLSRLDALFGRFEDVFSVLKKMMQNAEQELNSCASLDSAAIEALEKLSETEHKMSTIE